ncbi:OmpA-like transmembrane region:Fibronectin, type III:Putative Ig [Shewanella piezotolerans WP3]|uniref:OmpA-like transmembrane region:Fibronectin, type III:Putative Ig n=2 Tax=Shewanella TaxID=22 RepID=B8CK23_SHEPW|nr:OmpA-like transmembrane region:Fibronectin, type III:Putative Ig [Shewanella piezotolerans WP3]
MMIKFNGHSAHSKTLLAAMLLSLLSACGSDDNAEPTVPGNAPPIANPVEAQAILGGNSLIDALANDTDPDGDALTIKAVTVSEGMGVASIEDNMILFEPVEVGTSKINYIISDGNGGEAESIVTVVVTSAGLAYVGSNTCISCHTDKESYFETGHNFKLTKVEGEEPIYPFTSLAGAPELLDIDNTLGNPAGWQDISYVIGGYKSSAMFIDQNGYIMSGDKAGVGVAPKGGQIPYAYAYQPNTAPDSHPYGYCGRCHTTGWQDYTENDNRNPNRQDDMPGMDGTFAMTGVQCESCHGAGSEHIKTPSKQNIVKIADARVTDDFLAEDMGYGKPATCTECHTTDDAVRRYPDYLSPFDQVFGGVTQGARLSLNTGFGPEGRRGGRGGRHAGTTMIGTDPDTGEAMGKKKDFTCSTCHNPHQSEKYQDQPGHGNAMVRECTDCHNKEFAIEASVHEFVAKCTDCHMPSESHLFKIDLDGAKDDPRHFSADGNYMKPWLRAYDSCSGCHENDYDERANRIGKIHL